MRAVDFLSVRRLPVPAGEPPVCDLYAHGAPVGRSLGGAVMAAAFAVDEFYLLFMIDDVPREEGLTIHLLDRVDYQAVESVGLAWPYAAGRLRDVEIIDSRSMYFRFFTERVCLTVLRRAGWRWPFIPDFVGVFRPFGIRRRMRLRRI